VILDHHERFAAVYDNLYAARYGAWRPEVGTTFCRFLECGVLANGFLRVRCATCAHEVRVPWSCKKVGLCPSCAQRRSLEFGAFVDGELLEEVPYRHVVFVIPKVLRPIFLRERKLLGELGRCAWQTVRRGLATVLGRSVTPAAVTALALTGDTVNLHPHVHAIFSAGAWEGPAGDARFRPWPAAVDGARLTELFRRLVLQMLVRRHRLAASGRWPPWTSWPNCPRCSPTAGSTWCRIGDGAATARGGRAVRRGPPRVPRAPRGRPPPPRRRTGRTRPFSRNARPSAWRGRPS
jgi:hypothetical protein